MTAENSEMSEKSWLCHNAEAPVRPNRVTDMRVTLCSKGLRASGCTGVRLSNEGGGARLALLLLFAVPTGLQAQAPPNVTPPPDDSVYAVDDEARG